MTHIPRNKDHHLHNPDGTHRATPAETQNSLGGWGKPTAVRGQDLDLWEKQTQRHQRRHREEPHD